MLLENQSDPKVEVKIKTTEDHNKKQYWFAEDENQNEFFFADKQGNGDFSPESSKEINPELVVMYGEDGKLPKYWQFYSLEELEEALYKYVELKKLPPEPEELSKEPRKPKEPQLVKTIFL